VEALGVAVLPRSPRLDGEGANAPCSKPAMPRPAGARPRIADHCAADRPPCRPFPRRRQTSFEALRPPLASRKGLPISLREVPEHLDVQGLAHDQLLQPHGLLAPQPAALGPPALECRLAHLPVLQHCRQILACVQHRVGVMQVGNDLLRTVLLPSSRCHRKSPYPKGSGPSYPLDQVFQGRPGAQPADKEGSSAHHAWRLPEISNNSYHRPRTSPGPDKPCASSRDRRALRLV
jgi:hypothetical protein